MKFENKEGSVKVSNGGDAHKFKISNESAVMVIDSLINLYSDPVGSLMRELVSNAIDANRERDLKIAGEVPLEDGDILENFSTIEDKPCVEVTYIEGNKLLGIEHCISIKDWGNGLSPDRVESVFTVMGTSTKRVTDKLIGGYGIGAKSAFAYTDTFYVKATHNKVERMYMLFKGNALPEMHVVHEKPAEEKNNTEVIIPLKDSSDIYDFQEAIETQLLFFGNIAYKGFSKDYFLPSYVYETEDIILPDASTGDKLKCLVGRVIYPIDYSLLPDEYNRKNAGVHGYLRFKIGEVDLIPSRENLRYTEKTINAIVDKIKKAAEEALAEVQNRISNEPDFLKWYIEIKSLPSACSSSYRYSAPENTVGNGLNALIQLAQFSADNADLANVISKHWPEAPTNIVALLKDMESKDFTIGTEVKTLESYYSKSFNEYRERLQVVSLSHLIEKLVEGHPNIYYVEGKYNGLKTAALAKEHDKNFYLFKLDVFAQYLGNASSRGIRYDKETLEEAGDFVINYIKTNYAHKYKLYSDVSTKEVSAKDDLDISIQEYRKLNQTIFYKELTRDLHPNSYSWGDLPFKIQSEGCKVAELEDFVKDGGMLIYGYSDQDSLLKMCGGILMSLQQVYRGNNSNMKHLHSYTSGMRNYRIIKVAKNLSSQLAQFTYINDFFMDKYKELIEYMTCEKIDAYIHKINKSLLNEEKVDFTVIDPIAAAVYARVKEEFSSFAENSSRISGSTAIVEQVLEMCTEYGLYNTDLIESAEALVKYVESFPLLLTVRKGYSEKEDTLKASCVALGEFRKFKGIELPECPYSIALAETIPELNEE